MTVRGGGEGSEYIKEKAALFVSKMGELVVLR